MEELARVIENRGDNVLVRVIRNSACSKCDKDCGMSDTSHESDEIDVEIANSMGAEKGNFVKIEMGEKSIVLASLIIYLFPLIALIGGYFLGNSIISLLGYTTTEVSGIISSISFFALAFILIRMFNFKLQMMKIFQPEIVEVLK